MKINVFNCFLLFSILLGSKVVYVSGVQNQLSNQRKGFLGNEILSKLYEKEACDMNCKQLMIELDSDQELLKCVTERFSTFMINNEDVSAERAFRT